MPATVVSGDGGQERVKPASPCVEVSYLPPGCNPAASRNRVRGMGGIAVDAGVASDQAVTRSSGGQALRILVVWGVRFLGEGLAEILERDPLLSVVGVCADLSEAV